MKSNQTIKSEREAVLDILLNVLEEGGFSGNALDRELNRQPRSPESRAFITRLTEGTIERVITIDDVLDSCASVPCRKMKPVIRNILRESVYQMLFMDNVADAVAVNEAVALAKKRGFAGLAKFVNGVLRTVGRKKESFSFYRGKETKPGLGDSEKTEGEKTESASVEGSKGKTDIIFAEGYKGKTDIIFAEGYKGKTDIVFAEGYKGKTEKILYQDRKKEADDKSQKHEKEANAKSDGNNSKWAKDTSIFYSVPVWLVRHMESAAGRDGAEAMFKDFLTVRPLQARVNLANVDKRKVVESLTAEGLHVSEHPYLDDVILLESASRLTRTEAFREGQIQIQDASSVLAVAAAGIRPGMRVLDVCAAPGGKSLYAADLHSSVVRSRDLTDAKVAKIRENAVRCHFDDIICPEVADARVFDLALEAWADVVIADLPCSGLGVIAKKPDIKYRVQPEDLTNLAALQREILSVVWRYVKPGGVLIYSTCTVSPKENQENVCWFLSQGYPMEADDMTPYLPERFLKEAYRRQNMEESSPKQNKAGLGQGENAEKPKPAQQAMEKPNPKQAVKEPDTAVMNQSRDRAQPTRAEKITELQLLPGEYETDGFFIARFRRSQDQEHGEYVT